MEDETSLNDMDVDDQPGHGADDQLAKKLIRYAISCEYSRTPIRRDGIKERGKRMLSKSSENLSDFLVTSVR